MGIEVVLITVGVAILIAVLARRRLLEKRLLENKEALSQLQFFDEIPSEIPEVLQKAPKLKGDGKFAYKCLGCIHYAHNFEFVRLARRIYFIEPTIIEVLLIPDPANIERRLGVAVTLDSKILGYIPSQEAGEMHKYMLAHSIGLRAMAKIYMGSRPEYNGILVDFARPLRLEPRGRWGLSG